MQFSKNKYRNTPLHQSEWDELLSTYHTKYRDLVREHLEGKPVEVLIQLHVTEGKRIDTPDGWHSQPEEFGRTVTLYAGYARARKAALDRKRNLRLTIAALIFTILSVGLSYYIWYDN